MTVSNPTVRLRWLLIFIVGLFSYSLLSSYTTTKLVVLCGVTSFLFLPVIKYLLLPFINLLIRKPVVTGLLSSFLLFSLYIRLTLHDYPAAMVADRPSLQCQKYSLHLSFDPSNNTFKGKQEIHLRGSMPLYFREDVSAIKNGVRLIREGEVLNYRAFKDSGGRGIVGLLLLSAGVEGWKVEEIDTAIKNGNTGQAEGFNYAGVPSVEVGALLSTDNTEVITKKEGLIMYTSQVKVPSVVFEGRLQSDPKLEILVTAPANTHLSHNLNGTFSETVLENNKRGQKLFADKIVDRSNVIRFNYPLYIFQNRILSNLLSFSWWWAVLLGFISILVGIISFFCTVVLDLVKDDTLKPIARRVLRFFKLIPDE